MACLLKQVLPGARSPVASTGTGAGSGSGLPVPTLINVILCWCSARREGISRPPDNTIGDANSNGNHGSARARPSLPLQHCNAATPSAGVARLSARGGGRSPRLSPRLSPPPNRNTATSVDFQRLQAIWKRNSCAPCCGSNLAESLIICGLLRCCASARGMAAPRLTQASVTRPLTTRRAGLRNSAVVGYADRSFAQRVGGSG